MHLLEPSFEKSEESEIVYPVFTNDKSSKLLAKKMPGRLPMYSKERQEYEQQKHKKKIEEREAKRMQIIKE